MERVILRHLRGSKANHVEEVPLAQFTELLLGRDPGAAVRFDPEQDDLVGRQHARIVRDASDPYRFALVDLESRNGTYLNKVRVSGRMPLVPGDVIQLGAGGPELQFDIDPLPAMYVKSTRLAGAGVPDARVNETRVAGSAPVAGVAGVAASGEAARPAGTVGKATVERMIGTTRREGRRNVVLAASLALVAIAGVVAWQQRERARERAALTGDVSQLKGQIAMNTDSLSRNVAAVAARTAQLTPTEIADKNAAAVVQIDFSWNLIYAPTGAQVFHCYVPNTLKLGDKQVTLMNNGAEMVPAYVAVEDGSIEPALTLNAQRGAPIAASGSGSGFVVTTDGFILTNRHVAANWRAPYSFDPQEHVGVLVTPGCGSLALDDNKRPQLVRPPARWIPSETKQTGPKREMDVFRGRQEYLMVRFRKNTNPAEASTQRVSDRHDVALIKINTPASLPKVELNDSYAETKVGDAVTVMGYPGVSDYLVAVLKSKDTFNRDAQQRVVPDPTLSTGNIAKVLRAADGPANDTYAVYAPHGDRYQLTINSTGGGNSGGPMFDGSGRVTGIFFAGRTGDVQVSFSVPIKYGMELMSVSPNTQ